jgi:hypothetical protein
MFVRFATALLRLPKMKGCFIFTKGCFRKMKRGFKKMKQRLVKI